MPPKGKGKGKAAAGKGKGKGKGKAAAAKGKGKAAGKGKGKAAGKGKGKGKGKKRALDEDEDAASESEEDVKPAKAKKAKGVTRPVDDLFPSKANGSVVDDFDAMLNQTNIGANNNKYYRLQIVEVGGKFFPWNRWGRVGENGQNNWGKISSGMSKDAAIKDFEAKFRAKSGNAWADRANFKPKGGKYTLIEIAYDDDDQAAKLAEAEKAGKGTSISQADLEKAKEDEDFAESELEPHVAKLMELIFNKNMFVNAMQAFEIDTKRMPLGNLSMNQVNQGFAVLEDLGAAIKRGDSRQMQDLSSRFFTVIPHAFGRNVPPVINNAEMLQKKKDMLNVLSDIEKALQLEKRARTRSANRKKVKKELKPNPLDEKYETLNTELTYVDPKSDEFKKIDTYMANTKSRAMSIIDVFRVDRNDSKYLDNNAKCDNRVLLWHGTNVAVVSAILSSGLRIMPHSGGRVGRGIYLATEHGKSAWYTRGNGKESCMFLVEAAMGKTNDITRDDSSLRCAPKGFDSVVARGRQTPDPKKYTSMEFDGNTVKVPQGKPVPQAKYNTSSFSQDEYLVYNEHQARIRYIIKFKMSG